MNTQIVNTNTTRFFLFAAAAVGMLLFVSITPSFGQKEEFEAKRALSRDGLIDTGYMTKADVSDDLDGSEDEYFYKFLAHPGKLTVTLEVDANETNAGAYLDLFGAGNKPILQNMLVQGVDGGSERVSKSVKLSKKQDIVIRIKGIKYGSSVGYTGTYKILLEGTAVKFTDAAPSAPPGQSNPPNAAPSNATDEDPPNEASSNAAEQEAKPDATQADKTAVDKKPGKLDTAIDKATTKGKKLLDLVDKVKPKKP